MLLSPMRYLVCLSLLLYVSCGSPYRYLQSGSENRQKESKRAAGTQALNRRTEAAIAHPDFERALYHCAVEGRALWRKYRFSGLLFFRRTADGTVYVVFQSQAGLSYFNFCWRTDGRFEVAQILDALDRPALIKALRKDLEILLGTYPAGGERQWLKARTDQQVLRITGPADVLFYFFDTGSLSEIKRVELWAKRRRILDFETSGFLPGTLPEGLKLRHLRAGFRIELKKISTGHEQE